MMDDGSNNHLQWEDLLRKMLPAGAPIPDEDQLDFSISVEYQPPTHLPHDINQSIDHLAVSPITPIKNTNFTKPPKSFHKYTTPIVITPVSNTDEHDISNVVSFDTTQEDNDEEEDEVSTVTASPVRNDERIIKKQKKKKKKKKCTRCGEGNRFREKEHCIVCDSMYCSNCLVKAMGSMPEGRKCVGCIGQPIDESRRKKLGKCSRMLSKVCSPLEVRQIMMAEKNCSANQLRPEQLVVNGSQLQENDLGELFGCPFPPVKLKPGRYWYDKDSGLWGQEGEKPDRIVSSKLNIGGKLQVDASNGNTQVYINGRQITKVELRVLKLAKVQCPQGTHFWLYEDGSYEEEGQNNIKGNIWGKASTRFISSLFCLPVPHHESTHTSMTQSLEQGRVQMLMLFGLEGSGSSTILKQLRFLYGSKLSDEELQHVKHLIQSNTYRYLSVLLEGRESFEEEALLEVKTSKFGNNEGCVYSLNPKFKHFSDWLLKIVAMGDFENHFPAATREYAPLVDGIWKDPAIQETYKRRDELQFLSDFAKYFLDQVYEISSNEYEPSENDILYAQGSTPISYLHLSFTDPMSDESPLLKYQVIRMSTKGKLWKWLDMFEDAGVVIYCIALSDYDQPWTNHNGVTQNKMLANRDSFESLVAQPCFADTPFVLILNKYDLFQDKIARTPLTVCQWFADFKPHPSTSLVNQGYYYVAMKFKRLYASITGGRKLFVWQSVATKRSCVEIGFTYIREVIRWEGERHKHVYDGELDDSFFSYNSI